MTPLQLSLTSSALGRLPPEIVNRISEFDQASWIQHVASLMADFYQLLIAMNWLDAKYVDYPPHSGSTALDLELTKELGLDRDVVSLLQQLPYVSYKHGRHRTNWGLESDFVLGGNFADFRDQRDLRQSRDPFYTDVDPQDVSVGWEDEYGQYMHPWYQPLNRLGNHGVVLLLNMKSRRLWVLDQINGQADPVFSCERGGGGRTNWNSLECYSSRPAIEVLQDFRGRLESLEWIPGGYTEDYDKWEYQNYKRLYLENGWPDKFNRNAFQDARIAFEDQERADYDAEEPLRKIQGLELRLDRLKAMHSKLESLEADHETQKQPIVSTDSSTRCEEYEERRADLLHFIEKEESLRGTHEGELAEARELAKSVPQEVLQRREAKRRLIDDEK